MSIKVVHIFFISLAVLISVSFGLWSLKFAPVGDNFYGVLGVGSLVFSVALIIYGINFYKKLPSL